MLTKPNPIKTMLSFLIFGLLIVSNCEAKNKSTPLPFNDDLKKFIKEMVSEHKFNQDKLTKLFKQVALKQKILDAISKPAEKSKPWHEYRGIFLTSKRINNGALFWQENQAVLDYAEKIYGVSPEIIVAIIGVETFYGRLQGSYRVMDALSTLAFHYPQRSKFFRSELKQFLIMSKEQQFDPLSKKGSYAGAMGMGQFIPSSYRNYAIDFNGDGQTNIWDNNIDAIGSVAHYFRRHGWKKDQPITGQVNIEKNAQLSEKDGCKRSCKPKISVAAYKQKGITGTTRMSDKTPASLLILKQKTDKEYWLGYNNFYVISRYNHSTLYSMAVYQLSQAIKQVYFAKKT